MRCAFAVAAFLLAATVVPQSASAQVRVATFKQPDIALDLYGFGQPALTIDSQTDKPATYLFSLQRARLGASAFLGGWGKLQAEIATFPHDGPALFSSSSAPIELLDLYAVFTPYRSRKIGIDLTMGQFRVPFSRQFSIQPVNLQVPGQLAWFLNPEMHVARDLGAMLSVDLWDRKVRLSGGAFNGGGPGKTAIGDHYRLATRVEIEPLGEAPRFEGDVRPVSARGRPLLSIGGGVMRQHEAGVITGKGGPVPFDHESLTLGADLALWYAGASFYGEFYANNEWENANKASKGTIDWIGWNGQIGYFPPVQFLREHVEIAVRSQGLREATLLRVGYAAGANVFFDRGHLLKLQAFFQRTDQYTGCASGTCPVPGSEDRFMLQGTAGF
jgi:hypothetical protein